MRIVLILTSIRIGSRDCYIVKECKATGHLGHYRRYSHCQFVHWLVFRKKVSSQMRGSIQVHFSELFTDTVREHGVVWAMDYYMGKHGMTDWEFSFWCKSCLNLEW